MELCGNAAVLGLLTSYKKPLYMVLYACPYAQEIHQLTKWYFYGIVFGLSLVPNLEFTNVFIIYKMEEKLNGNDGYTY